MAYCKVLVNEIRRLSVTVVYKAQNDIVKERAGARVRLPLYTTYLPADVQDRI